MSVNILRASDVDIFKGKGMMDALTTIDVNGT